MKKKIIIIGAGPGGLTTGMILAHRGFDVTIHEKDDKVGGRNKYIKEKGYKFDVGPTFLMMKFLLDEVFEEAGANSEDYLDFIKLDPMYRLQFADKIVELSSDHKKTREEIARLFPGNEKGFDSFMRREKKRFDRMFPCLQKHYGTIGRMLDRDLLRALPHLSLGKSMYQVLKGYYDNDRLRMSFTFQSKYLGMSPWDCPAAFMIIPYIEHSFGIYHTKGGLSEISEAMAKVFKKNKGNLRLKSAVRNLIVEDGKVRGVELEDGRKDMADNVIINSDFAYSMKELAGKNVRKYSNKNLMKKKYSCSTYMLYLGLDKIYDLPHHSIIFSEDYRKYVDDVFKSKTINPDISFYIRNASVTDKTLAPKGHSALYILVPVPNQKSGIDWKSELPRIRLRVLELLKEKAGMADIDRHIKFVREITPDDWENDYNVFLGATFNLSHDINQMLYFRPHNKFEELECCYLVGGGTHPGSGLPTIYESGRITANLLSRRHKIKFKTKNLEVH